jgi:hypothetical protein
MTRTNINPESPVTQSVDAVKALLSYMHRPADPLPEFVVLNDRVRLTLAKDGKAYYLTTERACSCPAATYHPGQPCKHMKALRLSVEEREGGEEPQPARRLARPDGEVKPQFDEPFRPYDDDIPRLQARPGQVAV